MCFLSSQKKSPRCFPTCNINQLSPIHLMISLIWWIGDKYAELLPRNNLIMWIGDKYNGKRFDYLNWGEIQSITWLLQGITLKTTIITWKMYLTIISFPMWSFGKRIGITKKWRLKTGLTIDPLVGCLSTRNIHHSIYV